MKNVVGVTDCLAWGVLGGLAAAPAAGSGWLSRGSSSSARCSLRRVRSRPTFTVNSAADTNNGICDFLDCTLREAINDANSTPGHDFILFQIGVGGSETIFPLTPLPDIVERGHDRRNHPDGLRRRAADQARRSVRRRPGGERAGPSAAGGTTIRGLAIGSFDTGIMLLGSGGNTVAANYLGIDAGGSFAQGNDIGIGVSSPGNTIGGTTAADRNVISGNSSMGIEIASGTGNTVVGNFVGTDASGNFTVPNGIGVFVGSDDNTIGTVEDGATGRNVISGNSGVGLQISDGSQNSIDGNYIGTDAEGTSAVPNVNGGVHVFAASSASSNTASANIISGNGAYGVLLSTTEINGVGNNEFFENLIGTDVSGKNPLGNTGPGVLIARDGVIGQTQITDNTIAYNSKGIVAETNTARNRFQGNSIHDNASIGIDLNDDGVTANDAGDADTGANGLVNFPVLETVDRNANGTIHVTGSYDGSLPSSFYALDFYSSPSCHSSGFGEGTKLLGTVSTQPGSFDSGTLLTEYVSSGSAITATATDTFGATSEFSACFTVPADNPLTLTVDTASGDSVGSCDPDVPADCSLPDAITVANATAITTAVTITFAIPGAPPFVIAAGAAVPHDQPRRHHRWHHAARVCGSAGHSA